MKKRLPRIKILKGGLRENQLPNDKLILPFIPEIDSQDNALISDPEKLIGFVSKTKGVEIKSPDVQKIKIEDFEEMKQQVEKDVNEKLSAEHQEEIIKISEEKERQRLEDRKNHERLVADERKKRRKELEKTENEWKAKQFSGNFLL